MKIITKFLAVLALLALPLSHAQGQGAPSVPGPFYAPNWYKGYVPTPYEWQVMWSNKIGYYANGVPILYGGTGATTAEQARINLGVASLTLSSGKIFVGNASNVTTAVTPAGDWGISNTGLTSVTSLPHVTDGSLANSGLAHSTTTVNGQTCTLGSTCTVTAEAASLTPSVTTITGGNLNGLLWNNGGFFANLASANSGVLSTDGSGVPSIIPWTSMPPLSTSNTWTLLQKAYGATTTTPGWEAGLTGDTFSRVGVGLNSVDTPRLSFGTGSGARDAFLSRAGVANLRFGSDDAASPIAQTISMQNVVAGTSNTAGADTTFQGSLGTGTGVGGAIVFKTSAAAGSGTSQNSATEGFRVGPGKYVTTKGINETSTTASITANVLTIDLSGGQTYFKVTSNANINTFTITGSPPDTTAFVLRLTSDGNTYTQTGWQGGAGHVSWDNEVPPVPTNTLSNYSTYVFVTSDGGATWTGYVGVQNATPHP